VPIANNLAAIQRVLEAEGVHLVFEQNGSATGITVKGNDRGGGRQLVSSSLAEPGKRSGSADRGKRGKRSRN
jgi:hypothetical protein